MADCMWAQLELYASWHRNIISVSNWCLGRQQRSQITGIASLETKVFAG